MGRALPRRGESAADRAERALLSCNEPPTPGCGSIVRYVDLYAGCGGLSAGVAEAARALARASRAVAAFEIDADAADIYATNFPEAEMYTDDVASLFPGRYGARSDTVERAIRKQVGNIDFLLAGPPCQGWSSLNNHTRGDDPKNRLYGRVGRAIEILEPRFVLIENVAAARNDSKRAPQRTIVQLKKLGYTVADTVVPLLAIGVPQRRRRHVVVAARDSEVDLGAILRDFAAGPRTLRWAIGDLTSASTGFDAPSVPTKDNERRMRFLRKEKRYNLPNWMRPECHRDAHTYLSMYGRLRWNEPAQTVTSGYGSMGQGRYVHPNGRRTLTPHEAARLQYFPDWFDFGERDRTVWATAIGNAVPPKLAYTIALSLLR